MKLLLLALFALADDNPTLTGKWQIQRSAAGNSSTQECTFTQKDTELTGTCTASQGAVPISGKVDGKQVTWTYKSESQGGPVTVVYKGAIESPGKLAGTVTAVEFNVEGDFTATLSK